MSGWTVSVVRLLACKFAIDGIGNIFVDDSLPLLAQLRLWIPTSALGCLESRGCRFQSFQLGASQLLIAVLFVLVAASSGTLPIVRVATLVAGAALVAAVPWSIWNGNGPMDREHIWMSPPGDVPWAALQLATHLALVALALGAAFVEWRQLNAADSDSLQRGVAAKLSPNAIAVEAATRARSRSPARNAKQD